MKEVIPLAGWEDFEKRIAGLRSEEKETEGRGGYVSSLLFRGQADSRWDLETTLERYKRCKRTREILTGYPF